MDFSSGSVECGSMFANARDSLGSLNARFVSPSKASPIARVMGKAKGLVRMLALRKSDRKPLDSSAIQCLGSETPATAIASSWRESARAPTRPSISILITSASSNDINSLRTSISARMTSNSSTTGVYSPDYPISPNPSLASPEVGPSHSLADFFSAYPCDEQDALALLPDASFDVLPPVKDGDTAPQAFFPTLFRVLLFMPWCIAVGATITLFPAHIERVVFSTGYIPSPSPEGARRFSFFSETAYEYAMIFAVALIGLAFASPTWGIIVWAFCAGRFVWVWVAYSVKDMCCFHERVGKDDMETLALVVSGRNLTNIVAQQCPNHPGSNSPLSRIVTVQSPIIPMEN
ncbi:hypothetical protein BD309DRAFT_915128 [Dichomitus squalens]|uniref:Uncharacterized protein n=1 Tax=Dichomitus squalens TaxID=114155 RepID=A0A4Q9P019_9APHY|nr:hypothetical protein BD309DRAFT_915128 [Dichomitus squalens]TBU63044.1 hypothetical protein BD310DRAFT_870495 [Dichomitus squalens]